MDYPKLHLSGRSQGRHHLHLASCLQADLGPLIAVFLRAFCHTVGEVNFGSVAKDGHQPALFPDEVLPASIQVHDGMVFTKVTTWPWLLDALPIWPRTS